MIQAHCVVEESQANRPHAAKLLVALDTLPCSSLTTSSLRFSKPVSRSSLLNFRVLVRRVLLKGSLYPKDFTTSVLFHPCTRKPVQFALSNGFDDRNRFSASLTLAFQQLDGMQRIGRNIIDDAVLYYSREHQRNQLTDWLDSLQWDKTPCLDHRLSRYCGAEDNIYV